MCFDLVYASTTHPPTHLPFVHTTLLSLSILYVHTTHSREVTKHTVVATGGGSDMDEESPLVINHNKGVVPTSEVHSNEGSELSSPPPDDGSSGGEQVYMDERSMHPPPHTPYVIPPAANMVPVVEPGGFISPGTHPPVLLMTAIQSEGFSSDRELSESPLQGAELRKQLVTQLEYYFSKENLSSDKYLCKIQCVCVLRERERKRRREKGKGGRDELTISIFHPCSFSNGW